MTSPPIVEVRHATVSYRTRRGAIRAVDRVSLAIAPGECVAILGRSGSGKSTLLALLGGLCNPTSGEVLFAGRSWPQRRPGERSALRAARIGMLLQDDTLLPGLRALENVILPAAVAGKPRAVLTARAEELLGEVGLADRWDAYPAELSGGQRRRVALARALAAEPELLLADEPTGELDAFAAGGIAGILGRLRDTRTTTIVIVTHDPALAAIADRRFWMEQGVCTPLAAGVEPQRDALSAVPVVAPGPSVEAFEVSSSHLEPQRPAIAGGGLARSALEFVGWVAIAAAAVALVDGLVARRQEAVVRTVQAERRLAEEMAMQDLRADVDDVGVDADGRVTVMVGLQNYRPERPLHVLGPALEVGIQREGRWEGVSVEGDRAPAVIRTIGAAKTLVPLVFPVPEGPCDELLRGYLHVRIGAAMVVSDGPDGAGDLFERLDSYYIHLRDPRRTEDEIRRLNGWGERATVPLWIGMPSH